MIEESKSAGVQLFEKQLELKEIEEKISENCVSFVLLNWNIILGGSEDKYNGHFVPITGYDDEYIYVNNSGPYLPEKDLKIKKKVFEKARRSNGTDEDIVFVSR